MLTHIPQCQCPEYGVANGMEEHVGIGMSEQPLRMGNPHSTKYERPTIGPSVSIVSVTNPEDGHESRSVLRRKIASARMRSSGVVTLMLS